MKLETIGHIERLQLHVADVKLGEGPYDARRIVSVDELWLTARGCLGAFRGLHVLDSHHLDFPGPKRHRPSAGRVVSIGFSHHHDRIAALVGNDRVRDAGENLVVASDRAFTRSALIGGVAIMGDHAPIWLRDLGVADPCVSFTRHVTGRAEDDNRGLRDGLDLLSDGVRGFVGRLDHLERSTVVRVGDEVVRSVAS